MKSILRDKKGRFIKGSHVKTEFKKGMISWNKGISPSEDTKLKISKSLEGENSPLYGISLIKEHRNKISKSKKGKSTSLKTQFKEGHTVSKELRLKISKANKGKKLSEEHMKKLRGKNNWNWKGGLSSFIKQIRNCFKYRQWRSDVYTRDNFTCQECIEIGGKLNAHHIKSFPSLLQYYEITTLEEALGCEELWNINNGNTLCKECHRKLHKKLKMEKV